MAEQELDPMGFASAAFAGPMGMNEQIAHMILGAVITSTRGIEKAEVKIDANIQRVFIIVTFRVWARSRKLKVFHDAWLKKAESRAREHIPEGWKILVYEGRK